MRYGYLGPATTFTHQALLEALARGVGAQLSATGTTVSGIDNVSAGDVGTNDVDADDTVPYPNVPAAMLDLLEGRLDAVMAPLENSVEGGVSGTLDALAQTGGIGIIAEQIVPITFVLATREPISTSEITEVASHSHAQAQCQGWVRSHLPGVSLKTTLSTAAAAQDLARTPVQSARGRSVICSPLAAKHFGLTVHAGRIEDHSDAVTRFVMVARAGAIPQPTGTDKTSLVVHLPHNRTGALLEMLEQFSAHGVNLSRIESRPLGDALGRYSFSLDVEGHIADRRVGSALASLYRTCPKVIYLGSYPRADKVRPQISDELSDVAFDRAGQWVDGLRAGIRG
ncbi:prephenate dehydratase [Devriesea agamarum]|uniref:prephenate dehydratase n=1 Tax=Devriesea agamarum TaxID=472569 RepID=UPI00071D5205|nr:prephenate dehydratase [Devriesea agamarum]